jgi:hypothetical protein
MVGGLLALVFARTVKSLVFAAVLMTETIVATPPVLVALMRHDFPLPLVHPDAGSIL